MLGAFAQLTGFAKKESIIKAIEKIMSVKTEDNIVGLDRAYMEVLS